MKKLWGGAALAAIALVCSRPAAAQTRIVSVTGGRVEGITAGGVTSFKGIPFAAPPVGNLRWRPPQPVKPWTGIKRADHFGPSCMQDPKNLGRFIKPLVVSENCLYLNVWTPAHSAGEKLPVMVWIYGGGYFTGSTSFPTNDGTQLAKQGVVLVSVSYRLGALGFLADPHLDAESPHHVSGNYGLLDMIAALKWVKANIARFGGDPSRVTIFGQSAGGFSVSLLAQSPLAKGLFQRAIAESGANFGPVQGDTRHNPFTLATFPPVWRAEALGKRFLTVLDVHTIAAARALDAQAVLAAQSSSRTFHWFVPVFDGYVLPGAGYSLYEERRFNDTPVLIGTNSDEGSLFEAPYTTPSQFEAQVHAVFGSYAAGILAAYPHATEAQSSQAQRDVFRDYFMAWRAWSWARLQSLKGNGKAYLYYFAARTPPSPGIPPDTHGSPHGAEVPYVFDNLTIPAPPSARALATMVSGYWVNFAKNGNPNGPGLPHWPAFNTATQQVMVFDAHPSARSLPNRRKLEAFDAYFAYRRAEAREAEQGSPSCRAAPRARVSLSFCPRPAPADSAPLWAFPGRGGESSSRSADARDIHLAGSRRSFTAAQLVDRTTAVDWFPAVHPPMPPAVRGGRGPLSACGFCHLPEGVGRPENAVLAGMLFSYLSQQLRDMRSGARKLVNAHFVPGALMLQVIRQTSPTDAEAAARYFSELRYTKRVKVIEAARIPYPVAHGFVYFFNRHRPKVLLGERIIEGPDDPQRFEMRDPRTTYTAYVPVGSIAHGAALAKGNGALPPPCTLCHGPELRGTAIGPPIAGHFPTYIFRQLYAFQSGTREGISAKLMEPIVAGLSRRDMIELAAYVGSLSP
jgi:para-nitrobenzyl esterase